MQTISQALALLLPFGLVLMVFSVFWGAVRWRAGEAVLSRPAALGLAGVGLAGFGLMALGMAVYFGSRA